MDVKMSSPDSPSSRFSHTDGEVPRGREGAASPSQPTR